MEALGSCLHCGGIFIETGWGAFQFNIWAKLGQNLGKTLLFSGVLRLVDRHVFILGPLAHVSCLSVFPERFCLQTAGMHD